MTTFEARFSPLTQIVRRRLLPEAGRVFVQVGDRVQPEDIIAEATLSGEVMLFDLAERLGIDPLSAARAARVREGQQVTARSLLARRRRFLWVKREVRAPTEGIVRGVQEGCLLFEPTGRLIQLRAFVPGEIVEVYPERGAAIRTVGALVCGAWGHGGEAQGRIVVPVEGPTQPLGWQNVRLSHRGAILVGGTLTDHRALFRARQFRVSGLVVGSIHPNLRPLCERLAFPILVTEGIGRVPMMTTLFDFLQRHQGRLAILSGCALGAQGNPELIIPLNAPLESTALTVPRPLQEGLLVRLTRPPYLGLIGRVTRLPAEPQQTAIGTWAKGAYVRLPNGETLFVPLANLEVVG